MRHIEHICSADMEETEDQENQDHEDQDQEDQYETKRTRMIGIGHLKCLDALIEDT